MESIIAGAIAGTLSGAIIMHTMISKLIKKLDAIEEKHREELLKMVQKAIGRIR